MENNKDYGMEPLNEDLTTEAWYTEDMEEINEWVRLITRKYELLERKRISDEEDEKMAPGVKEITEDVHRWDKEKYGMLYPAYAKIQKMKKAPFYDDEDDEEDIFTHRLRAVERHLENFQGEEWHTPDFQRFEMWLKYRAVKAVRQELNEPVPELSRQEVEERIYKHAIKKAKEKWKLLYPLYYLGKRLRRKFPFDK